MTEIRHAGPLPGYLADRHDSWHKRNFSRDKAWYQRLATAGQHPRAMLISCCDSRVDPVQMFGAEPGDLFVVRNVAALVPPYEPDTGRHGTSAAVEFAVTGLGVAHIVVVGHSLCGGVKACLEMCETDGHAGDSFIARWMDILSADYERVAGLPEAERGPAFEREAVLRSLRNLETFPFVREACEKGMLTLHGCRFDIARGALEQYDPATGRFA